MVGLKAISGSLRRDVDMIDAYGIWDGKQPNGEEYKTREAAQKLCCLNVL